MFKILVFGELMKDVFVYGNTRKAPDGPHLVFNEEYRKENDGGAGNLVANLKSLCPGIDVKLIHQNNIITKTRHVDESSNYTLLRIDEGDKVQGIGVKKLADYLYFYKFDYNAVVISDYCKGFLSNDDIEIILNHSKKLNIPTFIDSKKIFGEWSKNASFIKINKLEYENNLKAGIDPIKYSDNLIVTESQDGARYNNKLYPTWKSEVKDPSGCGDSFHSALIIKYLETKNIEKSILFGNKVASIAVSKKGVVAVTKEEANKIIC